MDKTIKFLIGEKDNNERIDIYLANNIPKITRSYIKKLILNNQIYINGVTSNSPSKKIKTQDIILLKIPKNNSNNYILPYKLKLDKIYEDNDVIIINKPKGLVVHPGAGNNSKTLVNALISQYKNKLSDISGATRPGIVHRIDKETSGLLVIAKNNFTHSNLSNQFSKHLVKRKYKCLIWGIIRPLSGKIETLISRNKKNRQLMTVSEVSGKKAITNYKTIKVFNCKDIPKISLIECELETGRTHQIRVHIKYTGSAILGDKKYGKKSIKFRRVNNIFYKLLFNLNGQALHAQTLEFTHPTKKNWLKFSSKLPNDFNNLLDLLKKQSSLKN